MATGRIIQQRLVQWDKDDLDPVGLLKIDILALGMLSAMRRTLDLVSARRGEGFELADISKECSGLMYPDTDLGENARHGEVFDEQAKTYVFP